MLLAYLSRRLKLYVSLSNTAHNLIERAYMTCILFSNPTIGFVDSLDGTF